MGWFSKACTAAGSVSKAVVKNGAKKAAKGVKGGTVKAFAKAGRRASGRR